MSNVGKGESYTWAFSQIDRGLADGFFLEAITLCESIMSDRLWSNLEGTAGERIDEKAPFANLIRRWRDQNPSLQLCGQVDAWRKERNELIHGAAKSKPGAPTEPVDAMLTRARQVASTGRGLARQVADWHRRELRASQSAES